MKLLSDKDTRLKLIFALGILGLLLILVSDFLPDKRADNETAVRAEGNISEMQNYRQDLEARLTEIVSNISGVGECRVMIYIAATEEYVYAEKNDTDRKNDSAGETLREQIEPVTDGGEPILKRVKAPEIGGAAIVCQGAENLQTKECVINAVSAALGLPSYKISVEPM